jgi:type VI secretion system protein ImpG
VAGVREQLLNYYERELTYIRQMGAEFAQKYPKIAGRLLLEPDRCEDPHVERLLEGFALLAARVHLKIDDDFPEISTALLESLYPHYIRPVPSMSVVQYQLDPKQGKTTTSLQIPKGSLLLSNRINGNYCKFRSAYDVTMWPLDVKECSWRSAEGLSNVIPPGSLESSEVRENPPVAVLRVKLACAPDDIALGTLPIDKLVFYLSGESNVANALYELMLQDCIAIFARNPAAPPNTAPTLIGKASWKPSQARLPQSLLRPVGFAEDEGVLPYSGRSFLGYRLLQEYFAFPEKFFFLELSGLEALRQALFGNSVELLFLIRKFERPERHQMLEIGVSAGTLKLNCTPIINLFAQTAEPIRLDHTKHEYRIVPDVRRQQVTEIFSIESVVGHDSQQQQTIQYEPFYAFRHASAAKSNGAFWHGARRVSEMDDELPTDVFLSLVNLNGEAAAPDADSVTVHCICTNAQLASKLPVGNDKNENGDFQLEGFNAVRRIVALRRPTPALRPPIGKATLWKLVSHLSLNYLSLVESGKEALQEILSLYNFSESAYLRNQINGIVSLQAHRQFGMVTSEGGVSLARGTRVEMELDEEQFAGGGVYLFCCVLERFLGLYASLNSFSQLSVTTLQRKEALAEWQPRSGNTILI